MKQFFPAAIFVSPQNISGSDRVRCHLLFLVLMFLLLPVVGDGAETAWASGSLFQASQAVSAYPGVEVYLDVADGEGVPLSPPGAGFLKATAGELQLPIRSVRSFADTGQGVGYVFLVDVSRSLGEDELAGMRKAISVWVAPCGGQDRFALVTFGSEVRVLQDFTAEKERFLASVGGLHPTDMLTSLHGALLEAQRLGSRQDPDLPVRRVVIVLSDGKNEALYGETSREVLRRLREASAPIFALGYYHPPFEGKKEYLQRLERFARASGGAYFRPGDDGLGAVFERLRSRIDNTWVVDMDVADVIPEGQNLRVEIGYRQGDHIFSDVFDVRLIPPVLGLALSGHNRPEEGSEPFLSASGAKAQASDSVIAFAQSDPAPTDEDAGETAPVSGALASKAEVGASNQEEPKGRGPRPFLLGGGLLLLSLLLLRVFAGKTSPEKENAVLSPVPVQEPVTEQTTPEQTTLEQTTPPIPVPCGLPVRLEVFHGRRVARSFRLVLAGRQTLGRSGENDISIGDDPTISGRHCELVLQGNGLAVRDLSSTNGTFVNNLSIEGLTPLADGDMLRIGQTSIHLVFEGTPGSSGGEV